MALQEYFERPRAPYAVFQWNGDNLADLIDWYDAHYDPAFARPYTNPDGSLSVPRDGGSATMAVGEKGVFGPSWYDTWCPLSDADIADRYSPIVSQSSRP